MLDLLGNWTGISYYESLRSFIMENTMKLTIVMGSTAGNLRASVTEICELPGGGRDDHWEKPRKKINEYQLSGKFDEKDDTLVFIGQRQGNEKEIIRCTLKLKWIKEEEKLEGDFYVREGMVDCQQVELHKGDQRRDLIELQEMGDRFIERIRRMHAAGLLEIEVDDGSRRLEDDEEEEEDWDSGDEGDETDPF